MKHKIKLSNNWRMSKEIGPEDKSELLKITAQPNTTTYLYTRQAHNDKLNRVLTPTIEIAYVYIEDEFKEELIDNMYLMCQAKELYEFLGFIYDLAVYEGSTKIATAIWGKLKNIIRFKPTC